MTVLHYGGTSPLQWYIPSWKRREMDTLQDMRNGHNARNMSIIRYRA
jgi:hypothetical protein